MRAADGWQDKAIAAELGVMPEKAARWRNRFLSGGMAALQKDAPRPGRGKKVVEHQFMHVGWGSHVRELIDGLRQFNVRFDVSS